MLQQLIKKSEYGPGFLNIEQIKIANTLNTYLSEKRSIIKVNDETIKSTDLNYALLNFAIIKNVSFFQNYIILILSFLFHLKFHSKKF